MLDPNQINIKNENSSIFLDSKKNPLLIEEMIIMDIETASGYPTLDELRDANIKLASLFEKFVKNKSYFEGDVDKTYRDKAALMPEYGRIVCVSLNYMSPVYDSISGSFYFENKEISFTSNEGDESKILIDTVVTIQGIIAKFNSPKIKAQFKNLTNKYPEIWLVGHNLIDFDIPFFKNRCFIHGILPPEIMYTDGLKPWESRIKDTLPIWRNAWGYSGHASLDVISTVLGVESPKEEMSGEMVTEIYHDSEDLSEANKILAKYCEGDNRSLKKNVEKLSKLKEYVYWTGK